MLLLLPPSEGKTAPDGPPLQLEQLAFARNLNATRRKVLTASGGARRLRSAPAGPAAEVYSGVLFGRLGLLELPAAAQARAAQDLLITSGQWGLLSPADRIPLYKLPIGTSLPRLGSGLAVAWRPAIARALKARDVAGELVIDMRSGPYAALWRPAAAELLAVRAFRVGPRGERQVISHMAKAARGDVARALLCAPGPVTSPDDVAEAAAAAGLEVELTAGPAPALDVLG